MKDWSHVALQNHIFDVYPDFDINHDCLSIKRFKIVFQAVKCMLNFSNIKIALALVLE